MAKLAGSGRSGPTLFIEQLHGMTPRWGGPFSFTDEDGAHVSLSADVVAHIISLTFHEGTKLKGREPTLDEVLDAHCSCKTEKKR